MTWRDPKSGEPRLNRGTEWFRLADGRIAEVRAYHHGDRAQPARRPARLRLRRSRLHDAGRATGDLGHAACYGLRSPVLDVVGVPLALIVGDPGDLVVPVLAIPVVRLTTSPGFSWRCSGPSRHRERDVAGPTRARRRRRRSASRSSRQTPWTIASTSVGRRRRVVGDAATRPARARASGGFGWAGGFRSPRRPRPAGASRLVDGRRTAPRPRPCSPSLGGVRLVRRGRAPRRRAPRPCRRRSRGVAEADRAAERGASCGCRAGRGRRPRRRCRWRASSPSTSIRRRGSGRLLGVDRDQPPVLGRDRVAAGLRVQVHDGAGEGRRRRSVGRGVVRGRVAGGRGGDRSA